MANYLFTDLVKKNFNLGDSIFESIGAFEIKGLSVWVLVWV
jgi:hypothetical protein